MSDIKIQPSATGNAVVTITPGVSNSARTLTLPDASGTVATTADITSTTTTANAALPKAGGTMSGALTITAGTAKFKLEEIGGSYGELEAGGAGLHINAKTGGYITLRPNGNTEAVRIASNGSVGIGTSSPAFENGSGLEIRYAGGNGAHLKLTDNASGTGATQGLDLYMFNTQAYIENYENAPTIFRNNGAESVRILANGKVGIGDSAPQDWLEVRSSGAIGGITISNSAHNQAALSFARSSTATARIFTSEPAATNTSAMHFQTSNASGGPNLITAMTIDENQKVGIGTSDPYGKLQIEGASQAWSTAPVLVFSSSTTGDARVRDWAIGPADSNYGDFHILQGASTGASPLATANSKMHINAVGNVAIGNAGQAIPAAANLYIKDAADSRVIIYESGASPYTSTLELASQAIGTYGALVQYTSGAEQLTIENYGRALNAGSTSGSIRFRTKVGNGSLVEVMKINGHEGVVTQPHQTFFSTNRAAGNQTFANAAWVDVDWTGEPYDTGANYVLSSGIFTAPVPGTYLFTGLIGFNTIAATNYVLARLVCSTAGDFYITHQQKSTGQVDYGYDQAISKMVYLVANETVKIQVYAASGGNHTLASRSDWQGRLLG